MSIKDDGLKLVSGFVSSINITSSDTITNINDVVIVFSSSPDTTALGTPIIDLNTNRITGVNLTEPGEGYLTPPSITVVDNNASPQTNIQITYTVTLGYKTLTGKIGETKAYEGTFTNVKSKLYQYNSSEVLLGKDVGGLYIPPIYQNNPTPSPQENNYNVFIWFIWKT